MEQQGSENEGAFLPILNLIMDYILTKKDASKLLLAQVVRKIMLPDSFREATDIIKEKLNHAKKPVVLSFVNAHAYNLCWTDDNFADALLRSDIVFRDGAGMKLLYKFLGFKAGHNLCGTDFIPFYLKQSAPLKIALLGTEQPYLQRTADKIREMGHHVVLTASGFLTNSDYLPLVEESSPDVIVLGMGMPKQEIVSALLQENYSRRCLMINGGAIIDYMGHKVKRAPSWIRKVGFEWLFRLVQEPKRLFKRYVVGNFLFVIRLILHRRTLMNIN
jgi:exopolysaccharide biosynthesis WecB/TagA/CpsF family protein